MNIIKFLLIFQLSLSLIIPKRNDSTNTLSPNSSFSKPPILSSRFEWALQCWSPRRSIKETMSIQKRLSKLSSNEVIELLRYIKNNKSYASDFKQTAEEALDLTNTVSIEEIKKIAKSNTILVLLLGASMIQDLMAAGKSLLDAVKLVLHIALTAGDKDKDDAQWVIKNGLKIVQNLTVESTNMLQNIETLKEIVTIAQSSTLFVLETGPPYIKKLMAGGKSLPDAVRSLSVMARATENSPSIFQDSLEKIQELAREEKSDFIPRLRNPKNSDKERINLINQITSQSLSQEVIETLYEFKTSQQYSQQVKEAAEKAYRKINFTKLERTLLHKLQLKHLPDISNELITVFDNYGIRESFLNLIDTKDHRLVGFRNRTKGILFVGELSALLSHFIVGVMIDLLVKDKQRKQFDNIVKKYQLKSPPQESALNLSPEKLSIVENLQVLEQIATVAQSDTPLVLNVGLPYIKELMAAGKSLPEAVTSVFKIVVALNQKNSVEKFFKEGLPIIKRLTNSSNSIEVIDFCINIIETCGENTLIVLENEELIKKRENLFSETPYQAIQAIAKIANESGDKSRSVLHSLLQLEHLLENKEVFNSISNDIISFYAKVGQSGRQLYLYYLGCSKRQITSFKSYQEWLARWNRFIDLTNDYNRERIWGLFGRLHLSVNSVSDEGFASLIMPERIFKMSYCMNFPSHFDFYLTVIEKYPRLATLVLEGLFEAVEKKIFSPKPRRYEQNIILDFIDKTNGFNLSLFLVYCKEGEAALTQVKELAKKALDDQLSEEEIRQYKNNFDEKGVDGFELLVAAVQTVIPSSGASFVKRQEVVGLFKKYFEVGDKRSDIPKSLQGISFSGEEISRVDWRLKSEEVFDPKGELKNTLVNLRYPDTNKSSDQVKKDTEKDRRAFIEATQEYLKEKSNENRIKAQEAFFSYARHNDLLKEKIDQIDFQQFSSLNLLEQLFLDKENLFVLAKELLDKEIKPELLEQKGTLTIEDPKGLTKQLKKTFSNEKIDKEKKAAVFKNILQKYDPDLINEVLVPLLDDEVQALVLEVLSIELKSTLKIGNLIEDLFSKSVKVIQQEKKKFEKVELGTKIKLSFKAVKGIPYSLWGLMAGVCIAPDIDLWKKKNFYLLAMIDENKNEAVGFIHLFEQVIAGKKVLTVPGINPSVEFLGQVDPKVVYPQIEEALKSVAIKGGYSAVYLPTNETILSNRSDILKIIQKKNYSKITLKKKIKWNHLPKPYPFNEVYVLPLPENKPSLQIPEQNAVEIAI